MLAGMKGAAEYEYAVRKIMKDEGIEKLPPAKAVKGMDANSIGHLLIMLFIIIGNLGYFAAKRRK